MAYTNLPPSLQDIFYKIQDRVSKLETGPNSAQYTADAAATDATQALSDAAIALAQASAAYTLAGTAIQGSTNTILNASNQMTAINGNGITIYSGASSTTGARVVLNSDGIAGFNSSGSSTFAIDATNGNVSITGASFTSGTIYGGSLNINGNCVINTSGFLTATGATITGTLTSANGSIGGWTLASDGLYSGASTYLKTSGSASFAGVIYSISPPQFSWTPTNSYGYMTSLQVGAQMNIVGGYGVVGGWGPLTSNAYDLGVGANNQQWNHIYLHNAAIVNSDARLKTNVNTSVLGLDFINSLRPVSYKMISGGNVVNRDEDGNEIVIGKDANGKDIYQITSIPGKRVHWGFLAQEVKQAVDESGVEDFAGWVLGDVNNPDSSQALAYEQFIAPIVKAIQEVSTRLDKLEGN